MKIALVQCPIYGIEAPSLSLASLYSFLKKEELEVEIFDFNAEFYNKYQNCKKYYFPEYLMRWDDKNEIDKITSLQESIKPWAEKIVKYGADVVCFSVIITSRQVSLELAKELKKIKKGIFVVFGGPDCAPKRHGSELLDLDFIDGVSTAEGEIFLKTIIESKDNLNKDYFKKVYTEFQNKFIKNLDTLPFPSYERFNKDEYMEKNSNYIISSRGCSKNCSYCSEGYFWKGHRSRSPKNVFQELKVLNKVYGKKMFYFIDSLINNDAKWVKKFCELVVKENLNVLWKAKIYPDTKLNSEILSLMKQAGCNSLEWGVESGSKSILRDMGRYYSPETAQENIRNCKKVGINSNLFLMVGFPTESWNDFFKTLSFLYHNRKYISLDSQCVSIFQILNDSNFESQIEKFKIVKNDKVLAKWRTRNGLNNPFVRNLRKNIVLVLAKKIGVLKR